MKIAVKTETHIKLELLEDHKAIPHVILLTEAEARELTTSIMNEIDKEILELRKPATSFGQRTPIQPQEENAKTAYLPAEL